MEFQLCHNILLEIEQLGFRVTWKFINIGLYGKNEVSQQISYDDIFEYFDIILNNIDKRFDDVVILLCEKENLFEVDKILQDLAEQEQQDIDFELHKWRVYCLKKILDNKNHNSLQGILELMEFWLPFKDEEDCPHIFPKQDSSIQAIEEYFSSTTYDYLILKNRKWLETEIKNIIKMEFNLKYLY